MALSLDHRSKKRSALLGAGLFALTIIAGTIMAGITPATADSVASQSGARQIVRQHLRQLGYTRIRYSQRSAMVSRVVRDGGDWKVLIRYGGNIGNYRGIVVVDAATGEITETPLYEHLGLDPATMREDRRRTG